MLPATGSTMTPAISRPASAKQRSSAATSLYGSVVVAAAIAAGTPAESGTPSVSAPLPAFTSSASAWPW